MATLTGRKIKDTYKDLLQISNSNAGIDGTLRTITDGEATTSVLQLSSDTVNIASAGALQYAGTAITATAAELNVLDGITATVAELNILDGVTSTAAELNVLDGYTGSVTELNYLDTLHATGVTATEFDYLDGVTSNIQTQLDSKLSSHPSISAASSSDNSGRTYIQDITLDSNGHVTGIATATETVTDTNLSTEEVQDIVGAMFTSNTETRISATYEDGDGTIDLVVDDMTADTNTFRTITAGGNTLGATETLAFTAGSNITISESGGAVTIASTDTNTQLTTEQVEDIVGGMLDGTETGISVSYDDTDGNLDFVVATQSDNNFTTTLLNKLNAIEAGATADQTAAEIKTLVDSASDSNVFTDDDHSKLDGIEASATADQTNAEIRTAVEAATDSNVFTDADHTKLNAIEASADVTDTTNVTAAGALMDSEVSNLSFVKGLTKGISDGNVLTANDAVADNDFLRIDGTEVEGRSAAEVRSDLNVEDGATADQTASEIKTLVGNASDSNVFTDADHSKLDGIEASADVTDATNVTAAGALMDSELTSIADVKALDQSVISGASPTFTTTNFTDASNKRFMTDAQETKLDSVESNATADQTDEEIQDIVGAMLTGNTETGITVTYQDGDGTIDFVVGTLNQDTTGSAATLTTARNIGGVSFDGSANIDLPGVNTAGNQNTSGTAANATLAATVTVADSTANTNFPVVFHDESNALLDDTGALRYNPSTGTLLVPNLSVSGTTTTVDTVTMQASNAIIFEGATADANETTLSIIDPTGDRTINLPNVSGTIPVLAAASTTQISSTPEELNILDGKSFLDEDDFASDSATGIASQQSIKAYVDNEITAAGAGDITAVTFQTDSGSGSKASDTGGSADFSLLGGDGLGITNSGTTITAAIDASQTTITSVLNTSLVLGRDADNQIKFGTDNQIIFEVSGGDNVIFKASGEIEASSLDISGDVDIDGTLEADAITVNGTTLAETISDTVGAMVSSNTESGITVEYQDADNTLDFTVGTLNQDTTGNAATATALETARNIHGVSFDGTGNIDLTEVIQDTVGAMFDSNTETRISASYQDGDGTIDLVVDDMTADNNTNQLTTFQLEDGDGTEVTVSHAKEVKFVEGGRIDINWTDTSNGTDGDPYDLTFTVDNDLSNYDNSSSGFLTAHPNISAASTSNNSGRTYIQDITLDSNGHVTGIATATETVTNTDTNTNQLTTFQLEDGDGTEVTVSHAKEVKFVEGGRIDINWTDTSNGTDGDPYDLTFTVDNDLSNYDNSSSGFLTAHPNISAASTSNNSGRTYIQDITLDSNGHVTGIATATETVTNTDTNTNQLTTFQLEDGDGTEVTISHGKEVKFVEGGGIDINWTDTSNGSDADPYDLTFTVSSQTDNNFTDADHSKLDGIEASADVTDTSNVTAAGALMDSECTNLSAVKGINQALTTSSDVQFAAVTQSSFVMDGNTISGIDDSGEFTNDDSHIMTSAAVEDKILGYGYTTNTGDITAVTVTAGDGLTGGGTASSGSFSKTVHVGAGTGITVNSNDVAVTAAQTGITSVKNTSLVVGRDDDNGIHFSTDNAIKVEVNGVQDEFRFVAGGEFHADADIVAFSSTTASDKNLKENVEALPYGLDDVMKMRAVEFDWKKDKANGKERGHDIGVIAQEMEEVIPEVVKEYEGLQGKDNFKAVDYSKLVPVLIKSIQELKEQIEELKK